METETFTKDVKIPEQFPAIQSPNVTVTYYNNSYNPHTVISVEDLPGITHVKYLLNLQTVTNYRLIGEEQHNSKGFVTTNFSETNTWKFEGNNISNLNKELYLNGKYKTGSLTVQVYTPYDSLNVTHFNFVEIKDEQSDFKPGVIEFRWYPRYFWYFHI